MTVIFAGLAGAFLLMIVFEWGAQGDFFRSGGPRGDEIGEVNGLPISNKEYQDLYQGARQQKLNEAKKSSLTDDEESEVGQKVWDEILTQKLIDQKLTEYGITITDQEVREKMFYNPPDEIKKSFIDSTGHFHQQEYWQVLRDPRYDTTLTPYVARVREAMKREKLQDIILSTIRTTNSEMWERFDIQNAKATFDLVKIATPQMEYTNYLSKVTDADINDYYEKHKWQYKQEEGRRIKFVIFRELPTAKDSASINDRAKTLVDRWKTIPLTETDSTLQDFARDYSEAGFQPASLLDPKMLSSFVNSDSVVAAKPGDVISTLTMQGQLRVVRVTSVSDTGKELYHLKHILISPGKPGNENRDSAKALAEKVVSDLRSGAKFSDLARQYSMDPNARFGGEMGWVPENALPPGSARALSGLSIGDVASPVETPSGGYDIYQYKGRTHNAIFVQTIPLEIKASSQTTRMTQQQATIFTEQAKKKGFDQAAKDMDLRVISDAPLVTKKGQPMFGYPPFTSYIFELSPGDITSPVHIANIRLTTVAQVMDVVPKGTRTLDEELKKVVKGEVAKQRMVDAVASKAQQLRGMLQPGDDLQKLVSVDSTLRVQRLTAGPAESVPQLGTEYELLNAVYNIKPGDITPAVKGVGGYYIAKLIELKPTDKNEYNKQKPQFFMNLAQEKEQRFFGEWLQNLKDNAKVKDFRIAKF